MQAKFIEVNGIELGIQIEPSTDDERLLLRAFSAQVDQHNNQLRISAWGLGGDKLGLRHIKLSTPSGKGKLEQRIEDLEEGLREATKALSTQFVGIDAGEQAKLLKLTTDMRDLVGDADSP